jgi:hypothetical protein
MRPPENDGAGLATRRRIGQEQQTTPNVTTERGEVQERIRRAKVNLTHAAAACLAGEPFASGWASAALAELGAARVELALREGEPC